MIKYILFFVTILWCFTIPVISQVKKEIIPMHSNCSDVKKILGVETCKKSHEVYRLADETVEIEYSTKNCQIAYGKRWNVSLGTVLSVIRVFKKTKVLKDFDINLNNCEKTKTNSDIPDEIIYSCKEYGVGLFAVNDVVHTVTYTPTLEDECLICK